MIYEMLQIVRRLGEENKEMRERLEKLEGKLDGTSRKEKEIPFPKARAM